VRANEIPLAATEMASPCCQHDALIEATKLDTEPALDTAQICGNKPRSDFVVGVFVRPGDSDRARNYAWSNKASSNKSIYIELEPAFQTDTL
jgi:hypothetical protein